MSVLERFELDGDTAIVTGGDRGIGRGIARGLAEAGADVVIANRDADAGRDAADRIATDTGAETTAIPTDVTDLDDVSELAFETVERFDGIDVLVNNAGITINTPAEEMSLEEWEGVIDVNLTGVFRCTREVGREMIDSGGGRIVNVSSISAFIANHPQPQVSYNASKAGVEGFTKQLASEWANYGIRINNINPGYVRTEMIDQVMAEDPDWAEEWFDQMLMEDMARPEDIAPLAVFLASEASGYMTGASIVIDGGYTVR